MDDSCVYRDGELLIINIDDKGRHIYKSGHIYFPATGDFGEDDFIQLALGLSDLELKVEYEQESYYSYMLISQYLLTKMQHASDKGANFLLIHNWKMHLAVTQTTHEIFNYIGIQDVINAVEVN